MQGKRNAAGLTPKQEAFARAYVECGNLSEAYRRSYDVSAATKPETIWEEASRVGAHPDVSARIEVLEAQKLHESLRDKAKLAAWVREKLTEIASTGEKESDRNTALALLGKHAAMFTEKTEVRETVTVGDATSRISELLQQLTDERRATAEPLAKAKDASAVPSRQLKH